MENNENSKKVRDCLATIIAAAYDISTQTDADIFVDYSPHINSIVVRVYGDGWRSGGTDGGAESVYLTPSGSIVVYCAIDCTEEQLLPIIGWLVEYAEKKGAQI